MKYEWFAEFDDLEDLWKPTGYTPKSIRDWRWLWLRRKTIQVPYWDEVTIVWKPNVTEPINPPFTGSWP